MMEAILRRYLQPSPTLRWHPWAPLAAALVVLAFVFAIGAQVGYAIAKRELQVGADFAAYSVRWDAIRKEKQPAIDAVRRAGAIDAAVRRYLRHADEEPGVAERVLRLAERWMLYRGKDLSGPRKQGLVSLAEFRLAELGGVAPAWQVTASYCDEMGPPISGLDLNGDYRLVAMDYSKLLSRTIDVSQVAPRIPNLRCEPKRSMP